MTTFLALYQGATVGEAKMIAVTANPNVVRDFAARLLADEPTEHAEDAVVRELEGGRRRVLRLVRDGAKD